MHTAIVKLCEQLTALSDKMVSLNNSPGRATEVWAWHLPALSPAQLALMPIEIRDSLEADNLDELTEKQLDIIGDVSSVLEGTILHMVPNIYGSPAAGIPAYVMTMNYVANALAPLAGWMTPTPSSLPAALVRKLSRVERDLTNLMPDKEEMEVRIKTIREAHYAAQALPTTMQELKETQSSIRQISSSASEYLGKISTDQERSSSVVEEMGRSAAEASNLAAQAAEAYRVTTTVGLAAAFEARARTLNTTVYVWVGGLAVALGGLMLVGYYRLTAVKETLAITPFDSSRVWVQVVLSLLSVGAPLWFAWLSTKQISQRFRLAEDYAFKAAVSKAYEGYRREAVRIDPSFEKALFASALSRLDEAPLRLVEMSTHGSPLHEFAQSAVGEHILSVLSNLPKRVKSETKAAAE
ncbi:hypothetical protein ACD589_24770 [Rhizobium sp. 814_E9_N1_1]|uniref:hypothetical protein n=1 Tax=unclassified Rhizobium TaxID=2613769 RepID=UPI003F20B3D0